MPCRKFTLKKEVELDDDPNKFDGSATTRKCTDLPALILMIVYFIVTISLTMYCIKNGDIDHMINGYDDCGNICGKNNIKTDSIPYDCFGQNMEEKKIVLIRVYINGQTGKCVENCTIANAVVSEKYCVSDTKFIPFSIDLLFYWKYIIISWLFSTILSSGMLILFVFRIKLIMKYVLWILNICLFGVSVVSWIGLHYRPKTYSYNEILIVALISTIALVVVLIFTYFMSLKLNLAVQLFREAAEAIISMPLLLILPFITSIIVSIILTSGLYGYTWVKSFAYLNEYEVNYFKVFSSEDESNYESIRLNAFLHEYISYPITVAVVSLFLFGIMWLYEFVINCQCMIIGGCVAKWFYVKNNVKLSQPIRTSISNLVRYHLGTICFGSAILNIIYVVRQAVNSLREVGNNKESLCACLFYYLSETVLSVILTFLDFLSQNGYIITAIYGYDFCTATIRAFKLIFHNIFNVIIVHAFGNFILIASKISVCVISCVIGFCVVHFDVNIEAKSVMLIIYASVSYLTVHCFMAQFEVAIDTILLCFCEDCQFNNGTSRPYHMSQNLAQFVENANIYTDPSKWKLVAEKWETGPKRV